MIPQVNPTIQDGALGIAPASGVQSNVAIVGPAPQLSSSTLLNTLLTFTDAQVALTTLGRGMLAQAVALYLASGVNPVYAVPSAFDSGGTAGTITHTGAGSGTVTQTGTANDVYEVIVKMASTAGIAAGVSFLYSLDGGNHWSNTITLAAAATTYVVPNTGITFTFSGSSNAIGDTYAWQTVAPATSDANVTAALTAAFAQGTVDLEIVHVLKTPVTASSEAFSTAAAVSAALTTAEGRFIYCMGIVDGGVDNQSASTMATGITTAFANFAGTRVMVCGGYEKVTSPIDGNLYRRPVSWTTGARLASKPPAEHPGRTASGALPGVASLYYDEDASLLLDTSRITTHRTIRGAQGYYVTRGWMMASSGSDYQYVMARRVMDRACRIARRRLIRFLNESLPVNPSTATVNPGGIDEITARVIEAWVLRGLEDVLLATQQVSEIRVSVDRTANIISTFTLPVSIRLTPVGYAESIQYIIGFYNPILAIAA